MHIVDNQVRKVFVNIRSIFYEQLLRKLFADLMNFIQIGHSNREKPGTRGHVHVSKEL